MEVRRIRSGEARAYREVRLRALRLAPYAYSTTFEEATRRSDDEWHEFAERLAVSPGLAGFVLDVGEGRFGGLASVRLEADGTSAEVNQMWVDEVLRGRGWADALLAACEGYALAAGAPRITLWVAEGNARAAGLYARCGFTPTGASEAFPGGGLGGGGLEGGGLEGGGMEIELAKSLGPR